MTKTVKHRDEHGRLLSVETRASLGAGMEPAGTVHVERPGGALRDRLGALTRKTHAEALRDATWDALVGLQLFDHNFHRAHQALRLPCADGVHRYQQRSPAMALGLTDHRWSFQELLTTRIPITLNGGHYPSIGQQEIKKLENCLLVFYPDEYVIRLEHISH